MSNTRVCKYCLFQIPSHASICGHCGAKYWSEDHVDYKSSFGPYQKGFYFSVLFLILFLLFFPSDSIWGMRTLGRFAGVALMGFGVGVFLFRNNTVISYTTQHSSPP